MAMQGDAACRRTPQFSVRLFTVVAIGLVALSVLAVHAIAATIRDLCEYRSPDLRGKTGRCRWKVDAIVSAMKALATGSSSFSELAGATHTEPRE